MLMCAKELARCHYQIALIFAPFKVLTLAVDQGAANLAEVVGQDESYDSSRDYETFTPASTKVEDTIYSKKIE